MRESGVKAMLLIALAFAQAAAQPPSPPAPPQQQAQPQPKAQIWAISEREIASVNARIAFPRQAGSVSAYNTLEFTRQNEGLDAGIQYRSPDEAVFATAYVYLPGLAHSGLAALATDFALTRNSSTRLTGGEPRVVAAGGVEGVAIRRDYARYRGELATISAFIKAERWMVKLRVSGPEGRRAEVEAAMEALLAGIRFGAASRPRPAAVVAMEDCEAAAGRRDANPLPDPPGAEMAAHTFLATFDGGGPAATNETGARQDLPSRVPARMCLSSQARVGDSYLPILRARQGPQQAVDGQTLLIAFMSDGGATLEVVHAENLGRFWLFAHEIGGTALLSSFDGVPSDEQIVRALTDPASGLGRIRSRVRLNPDGRTELYLPGDGRPTPPTT